MSDSTYRILFAERVKAMRNRFGWTQVELAERAGFTVGCVRMIEQGHRSPGLMTLRMMARAFGCSITDLTGE